MTALERICARAFLWLCWRYGRHLNRISYRRSALWGVS